MKKILFLLALTALNITGIIPSNQVHAQGLSTLARLRGTIKLNTSDVPVVPVVIVAGQSNAVGMSTSELVSPNLYLAANQPNTYTWMSGSFITLTPPTTGTTNIGFGADVNLGYLLSQKYGKCYIIKIAQYNTSLYQDWNPATTGGLYSALITAVNTAKLALASVPGAKIVAMYWHQGEADASSPHDAAYNANLTSFISHVRADISPTLPFIIGSIPTPTYADNIRPIQYAVATTVANCYYIDCTGLTHHPDPDTYHMDANAQVIVGSRVFTVVDNIITNKLY